MNKTIDKYDLWDYYRHIINERTTEMTGYTKIINNWVNCFTILNGKIKGEVIGLNCPHCQRFISAKTEDQMVDAMEHQTYCNPAHRRAEYGERF